MNLISHLTFLNLASYLEKLNNIIYLIGLLRDLIKYQVSSTGLSTEQVPKSTSSETVDSNVLFHFAGFKTE